MQPVSENYNPYPDERWSEADVIFELVDTDAAEYALATSSSQAAISILDQTHNRIDEMSRKIGSLEQNQFILDGSFSLPYEDDNREVGWWSAAISDQNGMFSAAQILEYEFTADQNSVGFTIIFDDKADEFAANFDIEVYDAMGALINADIVVGNKSYIYVSEMPIIGYRKVKVVFYKTAIPRRRIRIVEVVFGIIQIFNRDNMTGLRLLYEISPGSENLSSAELEVTIGNLERKYNMINPHGIYKYLQQGQGLNVKMRVGTRRGDGEKVKMGRFYYTASSASDDALTALIMSNDPFLSLDDSICRIGRTGTWTVTEAVTAVIADSGLEISAVLSGSIGGRIIGKCIPSSSSHREALRLIAQAAMSNCFFNRDDELIFIELAEGSVVDTLDNDNLYTPAQIADLGRINKVEITVRDEYAETETIYVSTNKEAGEADKVKSIENPLVTNSSVADWLLAVLQKRVNYKLQERGNPAREIGDTIKIYDAYNENRNAIVIREEYRFDGILKADSVAWGT